MKSFGIIAVLALGVAAPALCRGALSPFVHETQRELIANGDFDGDGKTDLVIVDKASGKYRLGYQLTTGGYNWVEFRSTGMKDVSGMALGKLLAPNQDALALTSADANQLLVVDISNSTAPGTPNPLPPPGMGPGTVAAIDIGGAGNSPLADLYVCTIYNSPDANKITLLRNEAGNFKNLADLPASGAVSRPNRLSLKAGQPEVLAMILSGDNGDSLQLQDLSSGKPQVLATASGIPAGADMITGEFGGARQFIFYTPGETNLVIKPLQDAGGKLSVAAGATIPVEQPILRAYVLHEKAGDKLMVVFASGENAAIYGFDGKALGQPEAIVPPQGDVITGIAPVDDGFVMFSAAPTGRFSAKYQLYAGGETHAPGIFGTLASLADTDVATVPDIQKMIVSKTTITNKADMKAYTNFIPGTDVKYSMVPIPGGEFMMGSPESEPGRQADEGPQHKVTVNPFWMGQFEITWNEYELFMFPDDERKYRESKPTDPYVDKLSDAVTRPSKPYVEMSFGMGKDGFPAISMTHHGANKYCHWLSAKTGHFYRLPTEAEWEFASRAGTTTTFYFGDDISKLPEHAWFEKNSDFKYQKVGKKKPNPWGLYDIYGNVLEWVVDQYDPNYYKTFTSPVVCPWNRATQPYPHAARGGSWDDQAEKCRSAARRGSDRAWKMQDPQLPKSIWYLSDAQFVGFRLVRPLEVPSAEEMNKYWNSGTEKD